LTSFHYLVIQKLEPHLVINFISLFKAIPQLTPISIAIDMISLFIAIQNLEPHSQIAHASDQS